ncbi:tetratricopeptide repeat protein [Kitasatospora viridis]|uniref:Tetratricopeptide repeat protein n=1 Tax=Kitasatospora viridis TaxID=281105 RepID=A0A561UIU1_9ACTN|nr:tetratricopeptide repeat protein [Kitasatospora viridis]TWF99293.1 tetratricopeptide repeat protein [Kitasatospora viridis]
MSLTAQRIAAVRAAGQGSGVLLTGRLVLTAAHLLPPEAEPAPATVIEAAVPGGRGWLRCTPLWRSAAADAALLLAVGDLVRPELAAGFEELRWGRVDELEPVPLCHAIGYPAAGREDGGVLRSHQLVGTLAPASGLGTGRHVLATQHQPPGPVTGAESPWSGMSGAPVVFNNLLLGLATADLAPGVWHHSQLGLVPLAPLLDDPAFAAQLARRLPGPVRLSGVSARERQDAEFEEEYARTIRREHGRLKIFGLPQSLRWDLGTAYLSLQAIRVTERRRGTEPGAGGSGEVLIDRTGRRGRVESLLKDRRRVLLRGQAGSGKTTLLQWLAVNAVSGNLVGELAELNYRVPFLLRLRTMFQLRNLQPLPSEFLAMDRSPVTDAQPAGWADRLFDAGRAILLVDGLDEIPQESRDEAGEWLADLLERYPNCFTLVTVRPTGVPADWLHRQRFEELMLCPMDEWDRNRFVERWHQAALAAERAAADDPTPAELAALDSRFREMTEALRRALKLSPELDLITDSPLLCAMICALHREWEGGLPERKMEVYESALDMLLLRRDKQRRIAALPEGRQLGREEQLALLQRMAAWLVLNGQHEGGHEDALRQIAQVLPSLPAAHGELDAERVLRHLVERTGLLSETSVATFEFVHRTFQDYLAAREFMEDRDFGLLAERSSDEQWADVVRMAVGHCSHRDRAVLLRRLLAAATACQDARRARWIRLIAAGCLPYASVLDEAVRGEVLEQLRPLLAMFPNEAGADYEPREWQALYAVGEDLLPLLTPDTELPLWLVCRLLERIGGPEAVGRLAAVNARIAAEQGGQPELTSRQVLARAYQEAGDLEQEIPALEQLVEVSEQVMGHGHPDTFAARLRLADAYLENGGLPTALRRYEQLLADAEAQAAAADLLVIRSRLGAAYLEAGAVGRALPLFELLATEAEALKGLESPEALAARGRLAAAQRDAGDLAGALTAFEWLLVDAERALGEDHPDTLVIRTDAAAAQAEAGDLARAIPALEQIQSDAARALGEHYPTTLTAALRLGLALLEAGDLYRAVPILEAVDRARTRVFGEDHPATFTARRHLAVAQLDQGDHESGLALLETTLERAHRVLGERHPEPLSLRFELGVAQRRIGEPHGAAELLDRVLGDRWVALGEHHPDTLRTRHQLAKAYWAADDPYRAAAIALRTLALCETHLSPDHPLTVAVRASLDR